MKLIICIDEPEVMSARVGVIAETLGDVSLVKSLRSREWAISEASINRDVWIRYPKNSSEEVCDLVVDMVRGWPENKTEVFLNLRNADTNISDVAEILIRSEKIEVEECY